MQLHHLKNENYSIRNLDGEKRKEEYFGNMHNWNIKKKEKKKKKGTNGKLTNEIREVE
jgi:hypothetical protein